jgi:hypothetical protein
MFSRREVLGARAASVATRNSTATGNMGVKVEFCPAGARCSPPTLGACVSAAFKMEF